MRCPEKAKVETHKVTCAAPATLGANTLSSGSDHGGRGSKTVDAARTPRVAGVDRGRLFWTEISLEAAASLLR